MNQILSFANIGRSEKQLKKVTSFFCFFIIVFAVILVVEGIIGYQNVKSDYADIDTPTLDVKCLGEKIYIKVNSSIGVQKVIYSWNDGLEDVIEKTGDKEFSFVIDSKNGTNDLNIKITDSDGNKVTYNPIKIQYDNELIDHNTSDNNSPEDTQNNENSNDAIENWQEAISKDKTKPTISLDASTVKGKIKIIAKDNVRMDYVTYSWNGEPSVKITGLSNGEMELTAEIDALSGENNLTIVAYDKAGNSTTIDKKVHGAVKPEINVTRSGDEIVVKITHKTNITKIEYNFNYQVETLDNINKTEYELRLPLKDGENFIIITAYEAYTKSEYKGKTIK